MNILAMVGAYFTAILLIIFAVAMIGKYLEWQERERNKAREVWLNYHGGAHTAKGGPANFQNLPRNAVIEAPGARNIAVDIRSFRRGIRGMDPVTGIRPPKAPQ